MGASWPDPFVVRRALGASQREMGALLGVHTVTVSRWERGRLRPSPHQQALLKAFGSAQLWEPDVGQRALVALRADVAVALHVLLRAAFGARDAPA